MGTAVLTKPKGKRATIYEVARMAKVSHVTVSRAFSSEASVSSDTRSKVLAAAKHLQYRPNPLAKGLNGARTQTMSIIWPMGYTFISEKSTAELVTKVQARGYQTHLANTLNNLDMVKRVLDDLLRRSVDAVVLNVTPETFDKEVEEMLGQFHAAIVVTANPLNISVDQIVWDRTAAIRSAVDHFIGIGRKKIGYVCHATTKPVSGEKAVRLEQYKVDAFVNRLREHGIENPERGIVDTPRLIEWEDIEGLRAILKEQRFERDFPFDAVLCVNDEWATILVQMLIARGIKIPQDVAIIGWNDSRVAKLCEPPLASVNRCNEDVVKAIEDLLFARLKDRTMTTQKKEVPMKFVWRESAG